MTNFDDLKLSVEAISGGKNTILLDDIGMPSIVVPFPKLKYADIMAGGTQDTLPAFIVDGVEKSVIYESKFQNIVVNDRAYSLPMKDPKTSITFDASLTACRKKGTGWHLHTNALWAAIQNWCYKNGTVPHGNSNYGQDYTYPHEKGVPSAFQSDGRATRTATGSGPVTWYHNYDSSGIADLCGNVGEWVSGFRLMDGEIQIIPNGNAMKLDCNMGATSTEWKAILQDGSLVAPGTAETLKYTYTAGVGITLSTVNISTTSTSVQFGLLKAESGITVPQFLKGLGLFPIADYTYGNGTLFIAFEGERLPYRGGYYNSTSSTGLPFLYLGSARTSSSSGYGFRSAFYE